MANPFGKTVKQDAPYAVYKSGTWTWKVLKTYKQPSSEAKDQFSRWFLAVTSPYTFGSAELGDGYAADIIRQGRIVEATPEWQVHYGKVQEETPVFEDGDDDALGQTF